MKQIGGWVGKVPTTHWTNPIVDHGSQTQSPEDNQILGIWSRSGFWVIHFPWNPTPICVIKKITSPKF